MVVQHLANSGTKGAVGELRVAVDLFERGYEVFRSLAQCCSCDLLVLKSGKILRVEVRTVPVAKEKWWRNKRAKDSGRQDVFAWVLPDRIIYEPSLEELC